MRFVVGRRCIFKRVRPNHQLTCPPAWAWDTEVLCRARDDGVEFALLEQQPAGRYLAAPLTWFWLSHSVSVERGHGAQRALPVAFWASGRTASEAVEKACALDLAVLTSASARSLTDGEDGLRQLSLF
jgi:hypothetical protein